MDEEILIEINKIRADPSSLIANLTAMLAKFNDLELKELGYIAETTVEGATAV
jgi:hypothetical protein